MVETKEEVKKTVLEAVVDQTSIEQSAEQFSIKDRDTSEFSSLHFSSVWNY